ncbi:MAG: hypothetical protein M3Y04_07205 [Actinomycetota bacterium]|nr:hypothetical protein [Actinomycetota bacterium]
MPLFPTARRRGPSLILATAVACGAALTGCDKQAVRVGFRPDTGAVYRYEISVKSTTTTNLGDAAPQTSVDDVVLQSVETVLDSGPDAVRVRVQLTRAGSPDRTFVVRFDRGAQLAGVDAVDGLPPDVLGPDGLPEFLPAAATAPPDRPLSPGEKWKIDATSTPAGGAPVRLQGSGQLVKVTTSAGRKVASIKADTTLPQSSTKPVGDATVTLDGTETTQSTATRTLSDGAVQESTSVTKGTFRLVLSPKPGQQAEPVPGTMSVEIRSQTRRLPDDTKKG